MPLKRTPVDTSAMDSNEGQNLSTQNIPKAGSTPNLNLTQSENITNRKRKPDDENRMFMEEIREMFKSYTAQTDRKLEALQNSLSETVTQNAEIQRTMEFISKRYDEVTIRTEKLEADQKLDRGLINQLENKLENLERYLNQSKLEIRNIPKCREESKDDLCKLITDTVSAYATSKDRH